MNESRVFNSHHWKVIKNQEVSIKVDAWHCANAFACLDADEQAEFFYYLYKATLKWNVPNPSIQWAIMEDHLQKLEDPVKAFVQDFSDYLLREEY